MEGVGYGLADMLPAYPEKSIEYVDQVLRDNAHALNRPVIGHGLLGIYPCTSRYFNMTDAGYRSIGEEQAWPPNQDRKNVFLFGGSTMVGFNVEDQHTIAYFLQKFLQPHGYEVYNFGCGSYYSRLELLWLMLLLERGDRPDITIFLDGCNDAFYAFGNPGLPNFLNDLYQGEKRRRRKSYTAGVVDYARTSWSARKKPPPSSQGYDLKRLPKSVQELLSPSGIDAALARSLETLKLGDLPAELISVAERTWSRYTETVAMVRQLGTFHGFETYFAWQPVPFFRSHPDNRVMDNLQHVFSPGALQSPVYHWLEITGFPGLGADPQFWNLSKTGENLAGVHYMDVCHYTALMAEGIAEKMADQLIGNGAD